MCDIVDFEGDVAAGADAARAEDVDLQVTMRLGGTSLSRWRRAWSARERITTPIAWGSGRATQTYCQGDIGPGGLAADVCGAEEEAEGAAIAGRQLQTAKGAIVEAVDGNPHGGHGRRAKRLDGGPQGVARGLRMNDDQPREVDAPGGRGGWIKSSLAVDDDQRAALPAGFASGEQAEGDGAAAGRFGQPLDEHAVPQAAAGEQSIEHGGAGGKQGDVLQSYRFLSAQLFSQPAD